MTTTDKLKRLAEAATQGPWFQGHNDDGDKQGLMSVWPDDRMTGAIIAQCGPHMPWDGWFEQADRDAAYIASANPQAILALIAENERLRAEKENMQAALNDAVGECDKLSTERDETVALLRECEVEMRSDVENRYDKDDVDSYPSIRGNYLQDIDTPNRVASFLSRLDAKDTQ